MPAPPHPGTEHIEVLPLVVVAQAFLARPSALPGVRDFVRRQLTTRLSDESVRTLGDRVADVLLDAAGASGTIQVSLRIFQASAEVDVLYLPGPSTDRGVRIADHGPRPAAEAEPEPEAFLAAPENGGPSFAAWLSAGLRVEGLTMDAAASRLDVSTQTISRWVSGTTQPSLHDLYRIQDAFGAPPFH